MSILSSSSSEIIPFHVLPSLARVPHFLSSGDLRTIVKLSNFCKYFRISFRINLVHCGVDENKIY